IAVEVAYDRRQGSDKRGAGTSHRVDGLKAAIAVAQQDAGKIESSRGVRVESGDDQVKVTVMIEVADGHRIAADVGAKWGAGAKLERPVGTAEKHLHASSSDVGDIEVAVAVEVSEKRGRRNHAAEVRLNLDGKRAVAVAYHQVYEGSIRPFRSRGNQIEFSI